MCSLWEFHQLAEMMSNSDKPDTVDKINESTYMLPMPATDAASGSCPAATGTDFALFDKNFDLNSQPANYFRQRSNLEKLVFQASRESTEKLHPQYSIRLASKFPKLVGNVDVISASRNVKSLLKMPYSPGSPVSLMVHRVGDSLLLDEFDLFAFMLRQDFENWHWLRHFAASNNMAVRPTGFKRDEVSSKRLMTKFLYHTASISDEASLQTAPTASSASSTPGGIESGLEDSLKCMVWNFENLRMLLGTNLPIFGGPKHPCISVRLRDSAKPINVLTGIDYWLDNMINGVPELAMCYHSNGLFKGFDIFSTEHIPRVADFDPDSVREIAKSLVWFLKANATKEGHTYWLFKAPNSDIVKLYDLTSLCQKPAHEGGTAQPSSTGSETAGHTGSGEPGSAQSADNPFATPVGMLCYRVARSCFHDADSRGQLSLRERSRLRRLLACSLQLLNQSEQHRAVLASCNLLLSELLLVDGQRERLELHHQRQQRHREQQNRQQQHQRRRRGQPHRRPHRQLLAASDAVTSMDLRQLMQSLTVAQSAADVTAEEDREAGIIDEEESPAEPADLLDDVDDPDGDGDSGGSSEIYSDPLARAEASLSHALAAARLLLVPLAEHSAGGDGPARGSSEFMSDLDSIPMTKSAVPIPLPPPSQTAAAAASVGELETALSVVAKSCLQVADLLADETDADSSDKNDEKSDSDDSALAAKAAVRKRLLLLCLRVAAAAVVIAVGQQSSQAGGKSELAGLELQIAESSADAMMQAYRSQDGANQDDANLSTFSASSDQQVRVSAVHTAGSTAASSLSLLLTEADNLLGERLTGLLGPTLAARVHSTVGRWLDIQGAASAECLSELVNLYRCLCDRHKGKRSQQLRNRLAGAVNEWSLRTLVEVKHAMAEAEATDSTDENVWKKLEKRLESALDSVKQVQVQQQQQPSQHPTEDAVYILANKALLLRALNECRHTRPRRLHAKRQQQLLSTGGSPEPPPSVSWAEIQLHDSAMQMYQAALDRLGPKAKLEDQTACDTPTAGGTAVGPALWDNLAWQRLMALVDKIEALTTAPVEGFSEADRCKEVIRLCRQALSMCDTESPGDRRSSFRYQAAQAHKNIADMLLRSHFEGWSRTKSLPESRSKWMSGYASCIRQLLSIRSDRQFRNPRMCLDAIGKLAKFQMDRADEQRKRAASTGEILLGSVVRYRHESSLLRILAVARHPLEELLAASDEVGSDWPAVRSLIRVVSREVLDAVRGLLQLAKVLRDSDKLEQVKRLYASLLNQLNAVVSTDCGQESPDKILTQTFEAFRDLHDWCAEHAAPVEGVAEVAAGSADCGAADWMPDFVEPTAAALSESGEASSS